MAEELADVLRAYGAAWNELDPARRMALLEDCWAEDGRYVDPTAMVVGRAALSAHVGGMYEKMPGARLEITSGASLHHGRIHFAWRLLTAAGEVAVEGVDFGTLADDGRLAEIVGFFGPPPPL